MSESKASSTTKQYLLQKLQPFHTPPHGHCNYNTCIDKACLSVWGGYLRNGKYDLEVPIPKS